jgi:fucose permease
MLFCAAAEESVIQFASSFMERGLGLPKVLGDILGACGFALFLGAGRIMYGLLGSRLKLHKVLMGGALLTLAMYLAIVFSPYTAISAAAVILCGFTASMLWPGTLSEASKRIPMAGASMFALLAAAGQLGTSIGTWVVGTTTDAAIRLAPAAGRYTPEEFGLRGGLLIGAAFPLAAFLAHRLLRRIGRKADH